MRAVCSAKAVFWWVPDRKLYLRGRPAFVSALQQMGYDAPDDEQLFSMLMMDIDREFAREILDTGLRASSGT